MATTMLTALERVAPIIAFLIAITVVAELSDRAGVFDVAGHWISRRGRHRVWLLWLLFAGFAVACTVFLSLDTTAVLLTPLSIAIARQIGAAPRPFALTTLWIANTGSLILPISNLTNLLALQRFQRLGLTHTDYLRLAFLPGIVSIAATLVLILALHPGMLRARYTVDPPPQPHDRGLLIFAMIVCAIVGPAFAIGLPPWLVASAAALTLAVATQVRARHFLVRLPIPWAMAAGFAALTVLVAAAQDAGSLTWLAGLVGHGTSAADLLRVTTVTAATSNTINNLPAYLAIEPSVIDHPTRLIAALIGANAGPLVTPWASLATLLWLQRCRAAQLSWNLRRLALAGMACALLTTTLATLTLAAAT